MVAQVTRSNSSFRKILSDAHLIGQLANWTIDQIFDTELGFGNCSDCNWHETQKNRA